MAGHTNVSSDPVSQGCPEPVGGCAELFPSGTGLVRRRKHSVRLGVGAVSQCERRDTGWAVSGGKVVSARVRYGRVCEHHRVSVPSVVSRVSRLRMDPARPDAIAGGDATPSLEQFASARSRPVGVAAVAGDQFALADGVPADRSAVVPRNVSDAHTVSGNTAPAVLSAGNAATA